MRLEFHPTVSLIWIFLGIAAGGAVLWLTYQQLTQMHGARFARLFFILKTAALVMLLCGLINPTLTYTRSDRTRSRIVVLLDDSASMATRDMPGKQTRADSLREIWFDEIDPYLGGQYSTEVFRYGARLDRLEGEDELTAAAPFTDLAGALNASMETVGSDNVGAVLVLSDGENTGKGRLPDLNVPVFTVGIGSRLKNTNDLRMEDLDAPEEISAGTEAPIKLVIRASGKDAFFKKCRSVRFSVMEKDDVVYEKILDLRRTRARDLSFNLAPQGRGLHTYTFSLSRLAGETSHLNNTREVLIQVKDEKLKVLYFSTRLTSEFKPIRQELSGDPQIEFISVIKVAENRYNVMGRTGNLPLSHGFPTDPKILEGFDCLILGAFPAGDLALVQHRAIETYVTDGGTLVLLGGKNAYALGGWAASPVASLAPVIFEPGQEKYLMGHFPVRVTRAGERHPATLGMETYLSGNADAVLKGINRLGRLRPGADVLLEALLPSGEQTPIVVVQSFGQGRTMIVASNTLADWWTRGGGSSQVFGKLWRQSVRYICGLEGEAGRIQLSADRTLYEPHTSARITAEIRTRSGQPEEQARIEGRLLDVQGQDMGMVVFAAAEGREGVYQASAALGTSGVFRVKVAAWDARERIGSRELLLMVGLQKNEGADLALNESRLRALSASTGGAYASGKDVSYLLERMEEDIVPRKIPVEISLVWDSPFKILPSPYFLLFVFLVGAEWVIRRKRNMI